MLKQRHALLMCVWEMMGLSVCLCLQDSLIISGVVVVCTLFILIYWWNK